MTGDQIAKAAEVSRKSVFNYRDPVVKSGVAGLLHHGWAGGRPLVVRGPVAEEFVRRLEAGPFFSGPDHRVPVSRRPRRHPRALWLDRCPRRLRVAPHRPLLVTAIYFPLRTLLRRFAAK
jgi:hypothetical protein